MEHTGDNIRHVERQHKNDEAQQFLDDRAQLLDTIREMINDEIDRRGVGTEGPRNTASRLLIIGHAG